jgi:glutamyl-Q tRNA(Asp) synthetase
MTQPVFRFAPSPNGELHLVTRCPLSSAMSVRAPAAAGSCCASKTSTGPLAAAVRGRYFADLAWLGIVWEEPVVFQSQRLSAYRASAEQLERMGLLYPCFATAPRSTPLLRTAHATPTARRSTPGSTRAATRARSQGGVPQEKRLRCASTWEAAIAAATAKLQGAPLCFTGDCRGWHPADDRGAARAMGGRGDREEGRAGELSPGGGRRRRLAGRDPRHPRTRPLPATDLHRLLQVLLDLPAPVYHHHRLITDDTGRKLAKSARDTSLRALRESGCSPADIRRLVGLD